jgi:hypothetical protein
MRSRNLNLNFYYNNIASRVKPARNPDRIAAFLVTYRQIENSATHTKLHDDLLNTIGIDIVSGLATTLLYSLISH